MRHHTRRGRSQQTLAFRLTPPGEGGISLIEVSGPDAAAILDRLFISPRGLRVAQAAPGRLLYGKLLRGGAEELDEAIIECVQTGERGVYVVNCHGGALAVRRVMAALAAEGARPAGEKEFLARQRQAGRLDRIQEEAAEHIPRAPTLRAVQALLDQYDGALSRALENVRRQVRPGAETQNKCGAGFIPRLLPQTHNRGINSAPQKTFDNCACSEGLHSVRPAPDWPGIVAEIQRLLATAAFGRGLTRPPRLVIAGRPNVGKSTLANALLRDDRMIVHPAPGTTRDTIEELLSIRGLPFTLVDTAGLRAARDEIEREGVRRGAQALRRADIALLVFDASMPLQPEDGRVLASKLKRRLPILNKSDLPSAISPDLIQQKNGRPPVLISAATGAGLAELESRILETAYPDLPPKAAPVLFTLRQQRLINSALAAAEAGDRARFLALLDEIVNSKR